MAVDAFELGEHPGYGTGGRLAEEHDVGRWSHVGVVSRVFSHLALTVVASEIRAAGAGARRAAR